MYAITVIMYTQHIKLYYKQETICNTLYRIGKLTPVERPSNNCNTSWATAKGLGNILNTTST